MGYLTRVSKAITRTNEERFLGEKCDKKIANIPYKPLTDRMLEEPFWLGLLTVFIVLSIIGLVWCARRHFPEKLEKLLAEEAERNRHCTIF